MKIPIRNFADRIEKLNGYIPLMPGLIDSPQGANMKRSEALDEPKLAQLLLRLVPQAQQDQYQLIKGTIPVNLRATLDTLETMENWTFKCFGAVLPVCVTSELPEGTRQLLNPVCHLRSNVPNEKGPLKSSQ